MDEWDAADDGRLRIVSAGPPALGARAAGGGSRDEVEDVMSVYAGIGAFLWGSAFEGGVQHLVLTRVRETHASDQSLAFWDP